MKTMFFKGMDYDAFMEEAENITKREDELVTILLPPMFRHERSDSNRQKHHHKGDQHPKLNLLHGRKLNTFDVGFLIKQR